MAGNLDLSSVFSAVTSALESKQSNLNEADTYNHDHGDHMVQIFDLVQKAVAKKSDAPVNDQLAYASKVVEKEASSGSAKLYADGLAKAASNFKGADLNADNISMLVNGLMNVNQSAQVKENDGNMLGSLLSGLTGGGQQSEGENALGMDDLLRAGMAFYQSKQDGDSNMEAVMDALMAASPMGEVTHRSQSGSLVASTIMQFAQNLGN
ncbi:hypothetical protein KQH56_01790 [bacterium]|nr:hypothetical protein [bacterium]